MASETEVDMRDMALVALSGLAANGADVYLTVLVGRLWFSGQLVSPRAFFVKLTEMQGDPVFGKVGQFLHTADSERDAGVLSWDFRDQGHDWLHMVLDNGHPIRFRYTAVDSWLAGRLNVE